MSRRRATYGDGEHFAKIPESVMESDAGKTLPHAAFKLLAILLVGNVKESNGTLAATDSYCRKFGFTSRETRHRSLIELKARGLIVVTRQGVKMRKIPTLWAVTWWPIFNRDGQPLKPEIMPTHAYLHWKPTNPIFFETDSRDEVTPITGVEKSPIHTDLATTLPGIHTDSRWNSRFSPQVQSTVGSSGGLDASIGKLAQVQPHLLDADIARACNTDVMRVAAVRARLAEGWKP